MKSGYYGDFVVKQSAGIHSYAPCDIACWYVKIHKISSILSELKVCLC